MKQLGFSIEFNFLLKIAKKYELNDIEIELQLALSNKSENKE